MEMYLLTTNFRSLQVIQHTKGPGSVIFFFQDKVKCFQGRIPPIKTWGASILILHKKITTGCPLSLASVDHHQDTGPWSCVIVQKETVALHMCSAPNPRYLHGCGFVWLPGAPFPPGYPLHSWLVPASKCWETLRTHIYLQSTNPAHASINNSFRNILGHFTHRIFFFFLLRSRMMNEPGTGSQIFVSSRFKTTLYTCRSVERAHSSLEKTQKPPDTAQVCNPASRHDYHLIHQHAVHHREVYTF